MTEQKVHGNTKMAADLALERGAMSAESHAAVLAGELGLQEAKDLGKDRGPDGAPLPVSTVSKADRSRECMCGCGKSTKGRFAMGHDARVKGWILKAVRAGDLSDLTGEQVAYGRERDIIEGER